MAKRTVCNLCGKTIDEFMATCDFSVHTLLGYGSRHNGDFLDLDLCPDCADVLIDTLQEKCKVPVLSEGY